MALISSSFVAGACVAAWGFYFKSGTPSNERIKTAADGLIYSNILMILMNMAAVHLSAYVGLGLSILMLGSAFLFSARLPVNVQAMPSPPPDKTEKHISVVKPLAFLCLFVVIITVNSGLMYQVLNPAFAHHEWLVSWYWAVPYIIALYIMKNLPRKTNRTYILYVAIAMIGFAFIAFMTFDRSAASYLLVNTLMLGACGVYDLFWWSILGEMLDLDKNPAKILGVGLSANVLGVLLGGLIGNTITATGASSQNPSILALAVVCVTFIILPPLHKHLSALLKNHAYLTVLSEMSPAKQSRITGSFALLGRLTERESEIAALLLKGKTYRMIAGELCLSENTVKTHIKNIYSKFNIRSRTELINLILEQQYSGQK
jgi:DNA-binding CsgD family transcriptional regulator